MFIGDNGCGKSTLLQSIQFALTGKIPGVAEKNQELMKFCNNGEEMEVKVFLDNGIVSRKLYFEGTSVKEKVSCSPFLESGTLSEKNKAILNNTIGLPIALNFGEFINMNDGEKRKFIYSLLGEIGDYNKESVKAHIIKKGFHDEKIISKILCKYKENDSIEEGLKKMQEEVETQKKLSNAECSRLEESLKQLSKLKNSSNESIRGLEELKLKKQETTNSLRKVEKIINENNQKKQFLINVKEKKKILSNQINILESKVNIANKKNLEEELKKLSTVKIEDEILKVDKEISLIKGEINSNKTYIEDITVKGIEVKAKIEHYSEIVLSIKSQKGCCTIDKSIKCEKNFSNYLMQIQQHIKSDGEIRRKLADEYQEAKRELKCKEVKLNSLENNKNDLIKALMKNKDDINNIKSKIKDIDFNIRELDIKKEQLNEYSNTINQYSVIDTEIYLKQCNSLRVSIEQYDLEISKLDEIRANEILIEKTKSQYKLIEEELKDYKNISKILGPKGLQGEIVKTGLVVIEEEINETLSILKVDGHLFFECVGNKGKEIFNFGIKNKNNKTYFETLSNGEKLMVSLAILKVIIGRIESKTKVLIVDDIIHLDKENRRKLYDALVMLKPSFDNIIAMGAINKEEVNLIPNEIKIWDKSSSEKGVQLQLDIIA